MGKIVHLDKVREFMAKTPVFRSRDVELIVGNSEYASLLLHNLVRRGEARRLVKGWYTSAEDPAVAVFAFRPAYIGLQEALSVRNLWEQETNVVIVTCLTVRPGVRQVLGSSVILHRIDRKYFFGFEFLDCGGTFLPVSDLEKTLIDLAYYRELPGKEVLRTLVRMADRRKLNRYLQHYPRKLGETLGGSLACDRERPLPSLC